MIATEKLKRRSSAAGILFKVRTREAKLGTSMGWLILLVNYSSIVTRHECKHFANWLTTVPILHFIFVRSRFLNSIYLLVFCQLEGKWYLNVSLWNEKKKVYSKSMCWVRTSIKYIVIVEGFHGRESKTSLRVSPGSHKCPSGSHTPPIHE